ncbi:unnamed protein product [Staurois parvus]|uniref:Uncharacterized protein n=1 Tax=Staurois parvus TaxID=386267 RepID=A0ABN9DUP4_9NEOB|nr:unnamed protein product [Staurois parvus]
MYVKWFDTLMFYYVILVNLVNVTFFVFKFPAVPSLYVPMSQETEPRRQMLASAGGHYRRHCRRDIVEAQDKVREEQIPERAPHGKPECSSGLPLVLH